MLYRENGFIKVFLFCLYCPFKGWTAAAWYELNSVTRDTIMNSVLSFHTCRSTNIAVNMKYLGFNILITVVIMIYTITSNTDIWMVLYCWLIEPLRPLGCTIMIFLIAKQFYIRQHWFTATYNIIKWLICKFWLK